MQFLRHYVCSEQRMSQRLSKNYSVRKRPIESILRSPTVKTVRSRALTTNDKQMAQRLPIAEQQLGMEIQTSSSSFPSHSGPFFASESRKDKRLATRGRSRRKTRPL